MDNGSQLYHLFLPTSRAECVKIIRQRLGYTQSQLASDLGLSREQVSKMETHFLKVSETVWDYVLSEAYRLYVMDKHSFTYQSFKMNVNLLVKKGEESA